MDLSVLANLLLAGITAVYVFLTHQILRESKLSRLATTRSWVVADFEDAGDALFYVVQNIGRSTARDVLVETNPPLVTRTGRDLSRLRLAALAPGARRTFFFDLGSSIFSGNKPLLYRLRVSWSDPEEGKLSHCYELDVESYRATHAGKSETEQFHADLVAAVKSVATAISRDRQLRKY